MSETDLCGEVSGVGEVPKTEVSVEKNFEAIIPKRIPELIEEVESLLPLSSVYQKEASSS